MESRVFLLVAFAVLFLVKSSVEESLQCKRIMSTCLRGNPLVRINMPHIATSRSGGIVFPTDLFTKICRIGKIAAACHVSKYMCPETARRKITVKVLLNEMCTPTNIKALATLVPCLNDGGLQRTLKSSFTTLVNTFNSVEDNTSPSAQAKRCSAFKAFSANFSELFKEKCNSTGVKALEDALKNTRKKTTTNKKTIDLVGEKCYKELTNESVISRRAIDIADHVAVSIDIFRK